MTEAHTISEREYRKLLKHLRAYERYSLVGIEKNSREDLPWTVTVEGKGHTRCYCTFGTYPDVKERAERMIKVLNSRRGWGGGLVSAED